MATTTYFGPPGYRRPFFTVRNRTESAGVSAQRKPDEGQKTYAQPGTTQGVGVVGSTEKSDPWRDQFTTESWRFPGFTDPLPPTYATYRYLLLDPTVQLARSQLVAPIRSIEWDLEADEGIEEDRVKFIEDMLRPLRNSLVRESLRALDYGWAPFEVVWDRDKKGRWTIVQFKPLLVDVTNVVIDRRGQFAGIEQPTMNGSLPFTNAYGTAGAGAYNAYTGTSNGRDVVYLPTNRSFVFTFDGEAGNWYGRPLLENVRFAVSNWYQQDTNTGRLSNRATGVFAVIKFPPGTGRDEMGNEVKRLTQATAIGQKLLSGDGFVCLDNYVGMNIKGLVGAADLAKLAEASMWHVEILDFGHDLNANMTAILNDKKYLDVLKVRGYLIPERAVLQTEGGAKADSEVQSASSTMNAQLIAGDLIEGVNDELDDVNEFNWGFDARTSTRIKNPLLESKQTEIDKMVLDRSFTNPRILDDMWRKYNVQRVWSRRGLPKRVKPLDESEGIMQDEQKKLDHEMALAKTKRPSNGAGGGQPPGSARTDGTAKRNTAQANLPSNIELYDRTMRLLENRPMNGEARIEGKLEKPVSDYLIQLVTQAKSQGDDNGNG